MNVIEIAAGQVHFCAVLADQSVACLDDVKRGLVTVSGLPR